MRIHARKVTDDARGMKTGELWVECYLPFDPVSFASFRKLVEEVGSTVAAIEADPKLAELAIAPIDSHLEAMLQADVELLAERFLVESRKIDVMHDERARPTCRIVQSFVNTPEIGSPLYFPGAWVAKLRVDANSKEWDAVEKRVLDAVSFAAWVLKIRVAVRPLPAAA